MLSEIRPTVDYWMYTVCQFFVLRFFGKYPAMGVSLYRLSDMA